MRQQTCIQQHSPGSPTYFSLADIPILAGTDGASGMAPPISTRISARMKRAQEHRSHVNLTTGVQGIRSNTKKQHNYTKSLIMGDGGGEEGPAGRVQAVRGEARSGAPCLCARCASSW